MRLKKCLRNFSLCFCCLGVILLSVGAYIKTWPSNTNGGDLSVSDKAFLDDSVASVHVAYNAFVALCKNAFVASDSTRESAVFTQNTAVDCSGCLGATSGCCQDINMVCADYMTGTSVCPYNMYDCNGESVHNERGNERRSMILIR